MDNAEQWKGYPKRSESVICSNDKVFTAQYGILWDEEDDDFDVVDGLITHIVIPFDNTTWGISPNDDVWFSYTPEELGVSSLAEFNIVLSEAISYLIQISTQSGRSIKINTLDDLKKELEKIDYADVEKVSRVLKYKRNPPHHPTIIDNIIDKLSISKNSTEALSAIMDSLSPDRFSLQTYSKGGLNFTSQTQECWSDGECLLIRRDYLKKVFPNW